MLAAGCKIPFARRHYWGAALRRLPWLWSVVCSRGLFLWGSGLVQHAAIGKQAVLPWAPAAHTLFLRVWAAAIFWGAALCSLPSLSRRLSAHGLLFLAQPFNGLALLPISGRRPCAVCRDWQEGCASHGLLFFSHFGSDLWSLLS